jgi:pimeloyl-ACP methyl ester carboxylesterase
VPENRGKSGSRSIDLPYVVLPASTQPAAGAPLLYMAGGPGETSLAAAERIAADPQIGATHDVVILSQRGSTDTSAPLDCPAASSAYVDTFADDSNSDTTAMAAIGVAMQACLADFEKSGGDPSAYTISDTAADVIDLRNALQYPSWVLMGDSWSTKVMQLAATRDPQGVSGVVLNAFTPLGRDVKGDAYIALSNTLKALSARSNGEYPDLNADLSTATAAFTEDPVHGVLTNPFTGAQRYYSLTGDDLITIVQQALYDPSAAAAVPYMLERLADGDTAALTPFIAVAMDNLADTSLGQYWVEACRDTKPYWSPDPTQPAAQGATDTDPTPLPAISYFTVADQICGSLGIAASPAESVTAGPAGQPALIFASDTDPLVPVDAATAGQASFPNNQLVTIESGGRTDATTDACAMTQLASWLAAPTTAVQTTCSDEVGADPIIQASDVHRTSRFASVVTAVDQQDLFTLTIPLIFAAFALIWLVGWVITVIVQGARRDMTVTLLLSGIPPVTGVVFLGVLWLSIAGVLASQPGFTLVGVPTMVPWIGVLLGIGFLGIIPVWRLSGRAAAALATAATLVWLAAIVWFVWVAVLPS